MSIANRIISGYKQAGLAFIMIIVYGIISIAVALLAITIIGTSALANPQTLAAGGFVGLILLFIAYILFIIGNFAAILFSASRSSASRKVLGVFEAYIETFKLILELSLVLILALIFVFASGQLPGVISTLLTIAGVILILFFPLASFFYVLDYIRQL